MSYQSTFVIMLNNQFLYAHLLPVYCLLIRLAEYSRLRGLRMGRRDREMAKLGKYMFRTVGWNLSEFGRSAIFRESRVGGNGNGGGGDCDLPGPSELVSMETTQSQSGVYSYVHLPLLRRVCSTPFSPFPPYKPAPLLPLFISSELCPAHRFGLSSSLWLPPSCLPLLVSLHLFVSPWSSYLVPLSP